MRRVYMSFLGTTNYFPCNYIQSGYSDIKNVRFVQEATITWYCHDWGEEDVIFIFTTKESHKKNWVDDGHNTENGTILQKGLASCLKEINTSATIKEIPIPVGKDETEIWEIFSILFDQIKEEDQLYLDITHAFRSLPLLAMVTINYAKVVRKIQAQAIGYGAMEAIGQAHVVKTMDIEKRNVPVFDLRVFDQLLDWSTAFDRFIETGNTTAIKNLTNENITPVLRATRGQNQEATGLRDLANQLENFTGTMSTCRGKRISKDVIRLKNAIEQTVHQDLIKPLAPLLDRLQDAVSKFSGEEVQDGVAATRWCLQHNLIQQGFTLLQETMFTYVLLKTTGKNTPDKNARGLISKAVKIASDNTAFEEWDEVAQKNKEKVQRICCWLEEHDSFRKCMHNLTQNRNDLNHAGMNDNPMKAEKFAKKLNEYLKELEKEIETAPAS